MAPHVDTAVFVDVDGVLNVGISDHGKAPLLLSQQNCNVALSYRDDTSFAHEEHECIKKVIAVAEQSLGASENGTYMDLACAGKQQTADVLVGRLASIVGCLGDSGSVVLSSNWRRPKYVARVKELEQEVSKHLGATFAFDDTTLQANETTASDRLRCIGKHVRSLCMDRGATTTPLRVLVLDDFFVTPFNGWTCNGREMHSAADAEAYLRGCAPPSVNVEVKVVYCYEEWDTSEGLRVEVGAGLSAEQTRAAKAFVAGSNGKYATQTQEQQQPRLLASAGKDRRLPSSVYVGGA